MRITTLWGIPAHPLFVHLPVVLLPLVALGACAMAASAWFRERLGWLVLGAAIVAGLSTQLAIGSGQALRSSVPRSAALSYHVGIAESIRPLALLLFLVALAVMLVDRRTKGAWPFTPATAGPGPGTAARLGLLLATVVIAGGTTARLIQIGDSGAKATWQRVQIHSAGATSP